MRNSASAKINRQQLWMRVVHSDSIYRFI